MLTSEYAILQVLDLVVNGPLKAHMRNNRANKIVKAFRVFKESCSSKSLKPLGEREVLTFAAPKPEMMECISELIILFGSDGDFQKLKFKEGVNSASKKTGTIPLSLMKMGNLLLLRTKRRQYAAP